MVVSLRKDQFAVRLETESRDLVCDVLNKVFRKNCAIVSNVLASQQSVQLAITAFSRPTLSP